MYNTFSPRASKYSIQLKVQSTFKLTKQRINDSNIMKNELTNNDQLTTPLKQFYACRIFLKVNYSSELTTIDEKNVRYKHHRRQHNQ